MQKLIENMIIKSIIIIVNEIHWTLREEERNKTLLKH